MVEEERGENGEEEETKEEWRGITQVNFGKMKGRKRTGKKKKEKEKE